MRLAYNYCRKEAADESPAMLRSWLNTRMGETFDESYMSAITVDNLLDKLDDYEPAEIPEPVLCLVAGVDVQGGQTTEGGETKGARLECSIYGISRSTVEGKEELWLIEHLVIYGDPTQNEVWKGLEIALAHTYDHPKGGKLKVQACAIDTGGMATHSTYQFCRKNKTKELFNKRSFYCKCTSIKYRFKCKYKYSRNENC